MHPLDELEIPACRAVQTKEKVAQRILSGKTVAGANLKIDQIATLNPQPVTCQLFPLGWVGRTKTPK